MVASCIYVLLSKHFVEPHMTEYDSGDIPDSELTWDGSQECPGDDEDSKEQDADCSTLRGSAHDFAPRLVVRVGLDVRGMHVEGMLLLNLPEGIAELFGILHRHSLLNTLSKNPARLGEL